MSLTFSLGSQLREGLSVVSTCCSSSCICVHSLKMQIKTASLEGAPTICQTVLESFSLHIVFPVTEASATHPGVYIYWRFRLPSQSAVVCDKLSPRGLQGNIPCHCFKEKVKPASAWLPWPVSVVLLLEVALGEEGKASHQISELVCSLKPDTLWGCSEKFALWKRSLGDLNLSYT